MTVEAGKRADMILLEDNPLDDVANIRTRRRVIVRGQWLPESELQTMLAGLVESYEPGLPERLWPLGFIVLGLLLLLRHQGF